MLKWDCETAEFPVAAVECVGFFNRPAAVITLLFLHSLVNRTLHSPLKEFMGSQGNVCHWCCRVLSCDRFECSLFTAWNSWSGPAASAHTDRDHLPRIPVATKRNYGPLLLVAPLFVAWRPEGAVEPLFCCHVLMWSSFLMMGLRECWQKLLDWVCYGSVRRVFNHLHGKARSN